MYKATRNFRAKCTTGGGFTLAELLIVVAVIAVLVAVAVPTFGNQLEKSRQATDVANLRDVYAVAKLAVLNQGDSDLDDEDPAKVLHDATSATLYCWANPDKGTFAVATSAATEDQQFGKATTPALRVDKKGLPDAIKYDADTSLKADAENGETAGTVGKGILVEFEQESDLTYKLNTIQFYKNLPVKLSVAPVTVKLVASDYSTGQNVVTFANDVTVTGGTAPYTFAFTSGSTPTTASANGKWAIASGVLSYKGDLSGASVDDTDSVSITVTDSTAPTAVTGELVVTVKVVAAASTSLTSTATIANQNVANDAARTIVLPLNTFTFKYPDGTSATDGVTYTVAVTKDGSNSTDITWTAATSTLTVPAAASSEATYEVTLTASATKGTTTYTKDIVFTVVVAAST